MYVYDILKKKHDDDHVAGVRRRLWTAVTNEPIVYPPGDIYEHEESWQKDTDREKLLIRPPELPGNPSGESYSNTSGGTWQRRWWIRPSKYLCLYFEVILTCHKILWHGINGFTFPPKKGVLRNFIAVKNPPPRPGFNPRNYCPLGITLTSVPQRRLRKTIHATWSNLCVTSALKCVKIYSSRF
jgi:hypothetical protein